MTKKRILALLIAVLLAFTLLCAVTAAIDSNDYDYSSSDSGDLGDIFWFLFMLFDILADVVGIPCALIIVVIVGIIIFCVLHRLKKAEGRAPKTRNAGGAQGQYVYLQNRNEEIEQLIKKNDAAFNGAEFLMFSNRVFREIEAAWCAKNLEPVREYLHTNLYNATNKQIEQIIARGITYHYENITLETAYLNSYARDKQFEYLTVYLGASMIDYQTDASGNIVKGDKTTTWKQRYTMKYMRSVGVTTSGTDGQTHTGHCPNCGAPLELSASDTCEYCGSVITSGEHTWVLSDFGTVRNDTVDGGIKITDENNAN